MQLNSQKRNIAAAITEHVVSVLVMFITYRYAIGVLGLKTVFLGFGLDSDNLHSPNEKYDLANFYKGIETIPYFHQFFAEMKQ